MSFNFNCGTSDPDKLKNNPYFRPGELYLSQDQLGQAIQWQRHIKDPVKYPSPPPAPPTTSTTTIDLFSGTKNAGTKNTDLFKNDLFLGKNTGGTSNTSNRPFSFNTPFTESPFKKAPLMKKESIMKKESPFHAAHFHPVRLRVYTRITEDKVLALLVSNHAWRGLATILRSVEHEKVSEMMKRSIDSIEQLTFDYSIPSTLMTVAPFTALLKTVEMQHSPIEMLHLDLLQELVLGTLKSDADVWDFVKDRAAVHEMPKMENYIALARTLRVVQLNPGDAAGDVDDEISYIYAVICFAGNNEPCGALECAARCNDKVFKLVCDMCMGSYGMGWVEPDNFKMKHSSTYYFSAHQE
jgi:hypothetical protein